MSPPLWTQSNTQRSRAWGSEFGNYCPLKSPCEQAAEAALIDCVANIRPGFIVGPGSPTRRFPCWSPPIAKGGNTAAPRSPNDPVQIIDVGNLATFIIHFIERHITSIFNASGPHWRGRHAADVLGNEARR